MTTFAFRVTFFLYLTCAVKSTLEEENSGAAKVTYTPIDSCSPEHRVGCEKVTTAFAFAASAKSFVFSQVCNFLRCFKPHHLTNAHAKAKGRRVEVGCVCVGGGGEGGLTTS